MNMATALQIKIAVLSQILDRSITAMNNKHCNGLSSKIVPMQINISICKTWFERRNRTWLVAPWWRRLGEDDALPDGICVEGDDPRRASNEAVDEPWWRTWRSEREATKITSQKSYSSSPGAGSLRMMVPETYSPDRRCMSMNRMK
jgi:hypothetical protein